MIRRLVLCLIVMTGLLWTGSAYAQEDDVELSARAGFDGLYRQTDPVPVIVSLSGAGAAQDGEIQVTVGSDVTGEAILYTAPVPLGVQSDRLVPLYVNVPAFGSELTIRLVAGDAELLEITANRISLVGDEDLLYGVVSPDPGALAFLETVSGPRAGASVAFLNLSDLPEVSAAWGALDILVLDDTDTSRMSVAQLEALRLWVENGGQLIVTGGPGARQTATGIGDLLPVELTGEQTLDQLPALEDFTGSTIATVGPYLVAGSRVRNGEVIIGDETLPLLARRALGRGHVYFLALDPKLAPLAGWPGSPQLWAQIAAAAPTPPPWGTGVIDGYSAISAVSNVPGLRLPSILQLVFFSLIYIVVIGPVNYLVLKRLNRRELAWVTIPALVLIFSAATYFTSFRTRGSAPVVNEMAVAYGPVSSEQLMTQAVMGLYSPRRANFDLQFDYDTIAFPIASGFGTLLSQSNLEAIARSGSLALRGVRTDTSELATFLVETPMDAPPLTAEAQLRDEGSTPAVDITIRNDGQIVLEDAVLIIGSDQVALGDLAPGESRSLSQPLSASSVAPPGTAYNPLVYDPSLLLGTTDFYNDAEAFPRWQLIQALGAGLEVNPEALPNPRVIVTLAAWQSTPNLEFETNAGELIRTGSTLYLLEIPVE